MPKVIDTVRFLEFGKEAPKGSRFKGRITSDTIFGSSGWMDYTGREEAVEQIKDSLSFENGFIGYTGRDGAEKGITMSSSGALNAEKKAVFREECIAAFSKNGDLLWDMVISLESFETASKMNLNSQLDYGAAMLIVMPKFLRKIGLDPSNVLWWEDYHSNTEHPHMHVCFLEKDTTRTKGKLTKTEMNDLKRILVTELTVRQTLKEKTNKTYEEYFKEKDALKEDLVTHVKRIDPSTINGIEDLIDVLPKKGRLQYGSKAMIPYRDAIDKITDSILAKPEFQESFKSYLEHLGILDEAMNQDAGAAVATLSKSELQKLHTEIGNIILNGIKEGGVPTSAANRVNKADLQEFFDMSDDELADQSKEDARESYKEYKEVKQLYDAARIETSKSKTAESFKAVHEKLMSLAEKYPNNPAISQKLSWMFFYGEGVAKNVKLSIKYGRRALAHGAKNYTLLAKAFFSSGDALSGMKALELGSRNNDSYSIYLLGTNYMSGRHCKKNTAAGAKYIAKASELGCKQATRYLANSKNKAIRFQRSKAVGIKARSGIKNTKRRIRAEVSSYGTGRKTLNTASSRIETEIDAYLRGNAEVSPE